METMIFIQRPEVVRRLLSDCDIDIHTKTCSGPPFACELASVRNCHCVFAGISGKQLSRRKALVREQLTLPTMAKGC